MRFGPYELQVVGSNGVAYAEEQLDGKNFIRAVEGEEYRVKVRLHQDALGHFPFLHAKIQARLDGVALDCTKNLKVLKGKPWVLFRGFRKNEHTLRSFVFSSPSVNTSSTNVSPFEKIGTIEVTIFEAEQSNVLQVGSNWLDKDMARIDVQENKKFWQQPSLQTIRGNEFHRKHQSSKYVWKKLRREPDATLVLHYHTPAMIDFLRDMHLKKNTPATTHTAAGPPAHIDLLTHVDEAPVARAPAMVIDLMQDDVRVKREKTSVADGEQSARKRSRTSTSSAQQPLDIVDLT